MQWKKFRTGGVEGKKFRAEGMNVKEFRTDCMDGEKFRTGGILIEQLKDLLRAQGHRRKGGAEVSWKRFILSTANSTTLEAKRCGHERVVCFSKKESLCGKLSLKSFCWYILEICFISVFFLPQVITVVVSIICWIHFFLCITYCEDEKCSCLLSAFRF